MFPTDGRGDRWVFDPSKANIEKIEKPLVKQQLPNYDFYEATLTNYLGYHVNNMTCLIIYDSAKTKASLVEPLWYGGPSRLLLKIAVGKKFEDMKALSAFLKQILELSEVGSTYKYISTGGSQNCLTYDLSYAAGDTYTTGGNGISSTTQYNKNGVWRKINVDIKKMKIIRFKVTNPSANDTEVIN